MEVLQVVAAFATLVWRVPAAAALDGCLAIDLLPCRLSLPPQMTHLPSQASAQDQPEAAPQDSSAATDLEPTNSVELLPGPLATPRAKKNIPEGLWMRCPPP